MLVCNKTLARKYAEQFPGTVTLDEFKALRNKVGIEDPITSAPKHSADTGEGKSRSAA
jgi:hypothetical protein